MAQPFSPQQRDAIREKLKESARKYAVSTGVKKTSLDMLTADADETVLAAIRILYLSIININRIGTDFFPALHLLVIGACEELVA